MTTRPKPFIGQIGRGKMSGCVPCGRGFHRECRPCRNGQCHPDNNLVPTESENPEKDNEQPRVPKSQNLKDPESTGRKRAAKIYPITDDTPCEWQGKKNCGGGLRPIIGCYDGIQQHRHHGPVKRTTRNEFGNVHRICDDCHVHWHELNDLVYDEANYNLLPHDPVPATDQETIQNVLDWKSGAMRDKFELASSKNLEKFKEAMKNERV